MWTTSRTPRPPSPEVTHSAHLRLDLQQPLGEHVFVDLYFTNNSPCANKQSRDERIRTLWRLDVPLAEIAHEVELSKPRVSTLARKLGLPRRSAPPISPDERRLILGLYSNGNSISAIARRTGRYQGSVSKTLRSAGVPIRASSEISRKWPVRHSAFSPPCSDEAWYWMGFLAADGYVRGASLNLVQKAASHLVLERFLIFLGSGPRPLKPAGRNGLQAVASSPQIVSDLALHGVTERKTLTMKASPAAAAQPLFWLGVFDGDGSITISSDGVPKISLVGTEVLMSQFARFIGFQLDRRPPAVGQRAGGSDRLWDVRIQGDGARQLAGLWLCRSTHSMEHKRSRLEIAARYESRQTRARLGVRQRRCDYCGAWIERMPSQFSRHAFCNGSHFGKWAAARRRRKQTGNN
jgi:hypothetical protein